MDINKDLLDPDSSTDRIIRKNQTYRLPSNGRPYTLIYVTDIGQEFVTVKSQHSNKSWKIKKKKMQRMLDEGDLTVTA